MLFRLRRAGVGVGSCRSARACCRIPIPGSGRYGLPYWAMLFCRVRDRPPTPRIAAPGPTTCTAPATALPVRTGAAVGATAAVVSAAAAAGAAASARPSSTAARWSAAMGPMSARLCGAATACRPVGSASVTGLPRAYQYGFGPSAPSGGARPSSSTPSGSQLTHRPSQGA